MNTTLNDKFRQSNSPIEQETLSKDLQQANKIINAEYQQIDYEDRIFLTQVINKAIKSLLSNGGSYANS